MEALRKAEEAKRQAAQRERDNIDAGTSNRLPEGKAIDNPVDLDTSLDMREWQTPPVSEEVSPALVADALSPVTASAAESPSPSLDIPFDFHIDESFGEMDLKPVLDIAYTPEPAAEKSPLDSSIDPEIDYLKPEDLRQFKPASSASLSEVTLAVVEEPVVEVPEPLKIERPALAMLAVEPMVAPEPATTVASPQPAAVPSAEVLLRAQRNEEIAIPAQAQPEKPVRERFKVPGTKAAEEDRKRESARAVFNAKTGAKEGGNKRKLIVLAVVLALFPLAGGGYLFLQELGILSSGTQYNIPAASYDALPQMPVIAETSVPVTDIVLADVSTPASVPLAEPRAVGLAPAAVEAAGVAEVPAEPLAAPAEETVAVPAPAPEPAVESVVQPAAVAIEAAPDQLPPVLVEASPEPELQSPVLAATPAAPISITRSDNTTQVNAQLIEAYAAFREQDYFGARASYQQALREIPNNRDAMLGLAAVAIQLGDITGARQNYAKLLELNPRDVLARVGLMDSIPTGDPVLVESELRRLQEANPEVAQLSFALGNLYASQRRWNEAQASYYDALLAAKAESGSMVSPDFAFNLAVSLERLNQAQPAFDFYREALEQSRVVNPGFDVRVLRERLDALERVLP